MARAHEELWNRLAPAYRRWFGLPFAGGRRRALALLAPRPGERLLFAGCGPGFELDRLPAGCTAVGLDFAPDMLHAARARLREGALVLGDAQRLPFADHAFDGVALHLICAVAPDGAAVLREALRVTRRGGRVTVLDKLRRLPDGPCWRALGRLGAPLGTDFSRSFDAVLAGAGGFPVMVDEPWLLPGYGCLLRLEKR